MENNTVINGNARIHCVLCTHNYKTTLAPPGMYVLRKVRGIGSSFLIFIHLLSVPSNNYILYSNTKPLVTYFAKTCDRLH